MRIGGEKAHRVFLLPLRRRALVVKTKRMMRKKAMKTYQEAVAKLINLNGVAVITEENGTPTMIESLNAFDALVERCEDAEREIKGKEQKIAKVKNSD